ncbi:MAG: DUF58 domain-containing protein [Pirellulaceae bacterium]
MSDFISVRSLLEFVSDYPWLILVAMTAPLVLCAWSKRVYPNLPLLILSVLPCLLTGLLLLPQTKLVPLVPGWVLSLQLAVVLGVDAVVFLAAMADLLTTPGKKSFSAERQVIRIASLGQHHRVTLTLSNHTRRRMPVWIRDDAPQEFDCEPKEFAIRINGRSRATMHYEIRPHVRGAFRFERIYLRVRSLLGLWSRFLKYPVESTVNVYPDMKQISEYAVLARTNRLSLLGVRRTRRIGQDNEFERLRDYTRDDNFKHIEWRTTARRNKLTVKDFQTNQSQRLIFLIDCGRMMSNTAAGLSLLDHSLNSMLMLSYVALKQGDSVGLICFSDQVHNYVPPRGGLAQMNRLLHASFDRMPRLVESRYDQVFLYLSSHCQKRSMVVLMTNVIDEVNAHQIEQYLTTLVGRHLPMGVLMRDYRLFDAADKPDLTRPGELYRAAAAAEILTWRHQVLTDLEHKGVLSLDVFPEHMTAPLVNRYLDVKARHLL